MEFWEGAVLLVGGIWLVGRIHRTQLRSNVISGAVMTPEQQVPGATSETNTAGTGHLVWGEPLSSGYVPPLVHSADYGVRPCLTCGNEVTRGGSLPVGSTSTSLRTPPRPVARPIAARPRTYQL